MRSPTKPTRNSLASNPSEKHTIPDTTNHDAPKQRLISFSNMRRIKELQRAIKIQKRPTPKTSPTTKSRSNSTSPSIKNSSSKMLNRTSKVAVVVVVVFFDT